MGSTAVATATAVSYVLNASGKWVQRKNGSSESDETDIRENEYYCDSIVNLPTDTENYAVGTIFLCINECSLYILNSKKEWRDIDGKKVSDILEEKGLEFVAGEIYPNRKSLKEGFCDTADELPTDTSTLDVGTVYYAVDEGTFYL